MTRLQFLPLLRRAGAHIRWISQRKQRTELRLRFVPPCYWVSDSVTANTAILDCGLGNDADFSVAMINRYGVRSIGYDPTPRHECALRSIEAASHGSFEYHPVAVTGITVPWVTFHESRINISGSVDPNHVNVMHDDVRPCRVPAISLADALSIHSDHTLSLVKLDIEGSEYDSIAGLNDSTLRTIPQWIVEFHHDTVSTHSFRDTLRCARRFASLGYFVFTTDAVNFTFAR